MGVDHCWTVAQGQMTGNGPEKRHLCTMKMEKCSGTQASALIAAHFQARRQALTISSRVAWKLDTGVELNQTVDAWSESNRMNVKWRKALKTRRRSNYGGLNEARRQAGGQVCDACARRCRQHCWYGFGKSVVKVVTKKLGMNQRRTMTSLQLCCGSFPSVLTKQKALTQTGSSRDQRRPCCDN
ncbi:hypothetical protein T4B_721 [Trichinella pseudospiralis]|uniref:Uncharacterized protein n=1 Tax=Trichinella pseudospiralis TaxID=6337 RepID=A0A0V1HCB9_TRIPS|nr:hypothetical protein T4B_721 [Trichinella pseudospiralis]